MKDKYADQDEEEREARLQLIGGKKVKGFDNHMKKQDTTTTGGGKKKPPAAGKGGKQ